MKHLNIHFMMNSYVINNFLEKMKNGFKERWIHGKLRIFEKIKQIELTFSDRIERKSNNSLLLFQT